MDFILTDEQVALRDELRRFLADRFDSESRRRGLDRTTWRELAAMGVFGIAVSEADGGVGLGQAEAAVVAEELGRVAAPGPLIATSLAAGLVDGAIDGRTIVGAVERDHNDLWIENADDLDALLLIGADLSLVSEIPPGDGVRRPLDPLTPCRIVAAEDLTGGVPIAVDLGVFRQRADLLIAATQVGLGQAALDLGVEHALAREQFGRVIGSFQAVKHQLAEAVVAVEIARASVHAAAVRLDDDDADARRSVAGARLLASHAADVAARACIQVHGGMGYTWELDAHLFLKRSMVLDTSFGGLGVSRDTYASAMS